MNLPKMPFALIHSLFLDIDEGTITLNLQSYKTYTALAEAESLLRLMIFTSKGFSYLALNMQNDYSNHCTTFSEIIEKIEIKKKKKMAKIHIAPDYGCLFKQMEAVLSDETISSACIYVLLDAEINWL